MPEVLDRDTARKIHYEIKKEAEAKAEIQAELEKDGVYFFTDGDFDTIFVQDK